MPIDKTKTKYASTCEYQGRKFNVRWVNSSNVEWVGWPASDGEPLMLVKYSHDGIYGYVGVTRQRAVAAAHYPSTGEYINRIIKPVFDVVKIAE
jgi:hypothetical protein